MVKKWEKDMSNVSQTTTSDISNYVRPSENTSLDKILKTSSNLISTESVKLEKDESPSSPKFNHKYNYELKRIRDFIEHYRSIKDDRDSYWNYVIKLALHNWLEKERKLLHNIAVSNHPFPNEEVI